MTTLNLEDVDFLCPENSTAVPIQVGSKEVNMYPCNPLILPRWQKILTLALPGIREMFFNKQADEQGGRQKTTQLSDGSVENELVSMPKEVNLSQLHEAARKNQLTDLISVFTTEKHLIEVMLCVMDSARDAFPGRDQDNPWTTQDAKKVLGYKHMTIPILCQLTVGLFKANSKSIPLGERATEALKLKLEEMNGLSSPASSEANQSDSEKPKAPAPPSAPSPKTSDE